MTLYVLTHKSFTPPPYPHYVPLQVGRALHDNLGYLGDDTGENISLKNPYYSELTGLYWIWKNDTTSDIIGTAHYRRYLVDEANELLTPAVIKYHLRSHDLITTKLLTLDTSYYEAFKDRHHTKDLDLTAEVLKDFYPEYADTFLKMVHGNRTYFGNMIIAKRERYAHYCSFLFTVLQEVEKRIDMTGYDSYQQRIFGFLSEFLLGVYCNVNHLKIKECQVGMLGEKVETKELKSQLKEYFKKGDISGAKSCFLAAYEKRPDLLMEASDLNRECRLFMQAISSCELQEKEEGISRLQKYENDLDFLAFYRNLNASINCYQKSKQDEPLLTFLKKESVTGAEFKIALTLLCQTTEEETSIFAHFQTVFIP